MTPNDDPLNGRPGIRRKSRRAVLKLCAISAVNLTLGPLVSACSVLANATSTPVPTSPPTATLPPTPTVAPTATTAPTTTSTAVTSTKSVNLDNSRVITTKDNREICFIDTGKPDGIPVLMHNGTPSSRLLYDKWIEDAKSQGIRLISYDRPGYGGSSFYPGHSVASAADDVAAIAKELGLNRLLVLGMSGGGPPALACAALLPDLVVAAAALASPAPYNADGLDWFAGMSQDNVTEFRAALQGRDTLKQYVIPSLSYFASVDPAEFYQAFKSSIFEGDAAVLTEDLSNFLLSQAREGLKKGSDGWVDDDMAIISPWGFDPGQIKIPAMILQNEQDQLVPVSHGKWLAGKIKNVETRFSAKGGHYSIIPRIPEANTWLLSKWE